MNQQIQELHSILDTIKKNETEFFNESEKELFCGYRESVVLIEKYIHKGFITHPSSSVITLSAIQIFLEIELWKKEKKENDNFQFALFIPNIGIYTIWKELSNNIEATKISLEEFNNKIISILKDWITRQELESLSQLWIDKSENMSFQCVSLHSLATMFTQEVKTNSYKNFARFVYQLSTANNNNINNRATHSHDKLIMMNNIVIEIALKRFFWSLLDHQLFNISKITKRCNPSRYYLEETRQFQRLKELSSLINPEVDTPAIPVSFIGETSAGKSTIIKEISIIKEILVGSIGQIEPTTSGLNVMPFVHLNNNNNNSEVNEKYHYSFIDTEGYGAANVKAHFEELNSNNCNDNNNQDDNNDNERENSELNALDFLNIWNLRFAYASSYIVVVVCSSSDYQRHSFKAIINALNKASSGVTLSTKPDLIFIINKIDRIELKQYEKNFPNLLHSTFVPEGGDNNGKNSQSYKDHLLQYFRSISSFFMPKFIFDEELFKESIRESDITSEEIERDLQRRWNNNLITIQTTFQKLKQHIQDSGKWQVEERSKLGHLYFKNSLSFCNWVSYCFSNYKAKQLDVLLWGISSMLGGSPNLQNRLLSMFSANWYSNIQLELYYSKNPHQSMAYEIEKTLTVLAQLTALIGVVCWRNDDIIGDLRNVTESEFIQRSAIIAEFTNFLEKLENELLPCGAVYKGIFTKYYPCLLRRQVHKKHHENNMNGSNWDGNFDASLLSAEFKATLLRVLVSQMIVWLRRTETEKKRNAKSVIEFFTINRNFQVFSPDDKCILCWKNHHYDFPLHICSVRMCRSCGSVFGIGPIPKKNSVIIEGDRISIDSISDLLSILFRKEFEFLKYIHPSFINLVNQYNSIISSSSSPPSSPPSSLDSFLGQVRSFKFHHSTEKFIFHSENPNLVEKSNLHSYIEVLLASYCKIATQMNDRNNQSVIDLSEFKVTNKIILHSLGCLLDEPIASENNGNSDPNLLNNIVDDDYESNNSYFEYNITSDDHARNRNSFGVEMSDQYQENGIPEYLNICFQYLKRPSNNLSFFPFDTPIYAFSAYNLFDNIKSSVINYQTTNEVIFLWIRLYFKDLPTPVLSINQQIAFQNQYEDHQINGELLKVWNSIDKLFINENNKDKREENNNNTNTDNNSKKKKKKKKSKVTDILTPLVKRYCSDYIRNVNSYNFNVFREFSNLLLSFCKFNYQNDHKLLQKFSEYYSPSIFGSNSDSPQLFAALVLCSSDDNLSSIVNLHVAPVISHFQPHRNAYKLIYSVHWKSYMRIVKRNLSKGSNDGDDVLECKHATSQIDDSCIWEVSNNNNSLMTFRNLQCKQYLTVVDGTVKLMEQLTNDAMFRSSMSSNSMFSSTLHHSFQVISSGLYLSARKRETRIAAVKQCKSWEKWDFREAPTMK